MLTLCTPMRLVYRIFFSLDKNKKYNNVIIIILDTYMKKFFVLFIGFISFGIFAQVTFIAHKKLSFTAGRYALF